MKKIINKLFLILFFINLKSNQIKIYNKTDTKIYVATYYKRAFESFECTKNSKIIEIPKQKKIELKRPKKKFLFDRKILYSKYKNLLRNKISRYDYKFINKKSISKIYGNKFFIILENNIPTCLNYIEYKILNPMLKSCVNSKNFLINKIRPKISNYKHENEIAKVRLGNDLCKEEKKFLKKRRKKIKKAIEKLLNKKIKEEQIPTIAICLSGGSYRSAIGSLGTLIGIKEIGVFDCTTYLSTLCGSSLPVICWLATKKSLSEYKEIFSKGVDHTIFTPIKNYKILKNMYKRRFAFKQHFGLADICGYLAADSLLDHIKNKKQLNGLSYQAKRIKNGDYPMPIYAAVESISNYEWLEFNPYEVGSYFLNSYIPSWSFGREFLNGISINNAPELSYAFYMGLFCSAYTLGIKDLFRFIPNCNICKRAKKIAQNTFLDEVRFCPAYIPNFTYGMNNSPMQNIKNFKIIDAGFEFIIPMPPLLKKERKVDLVIIGDYSKEMKDLNKFEKYSKKFDFPLPKISDNEFNQKIISIYKDKNNPNIPVIIYLPFIKNENYDQNFDPKSGEG
ncbi:hypothetical protein GF385_02280, partial [Candidatus Dependentiae bacterium]|nr:hypothetical protein [Candidatus Dependentiae bacterium]